ncbi:MAG: DUF2058 family protein [Myxococcales bacterium]
MQSLKDKLIQAGVVSEDYRPGESAEARASRLNKEQTEKRTEIAKIVAANRVETKIGEHTFFFTTRSKKMRRLVIEEPVKQKLEQGEYAVVEWPNQPDFPWAVVPRAIADRILKIDEVAVRFYLKSEKEQYGVDGSAA